MCKTSFALFLQALSTTEPQEVIAEALLMCAAAQGQMASWRSWDVCMQHVAVWRPVNSPVPTCFSGK